MRLCPVALALLAVLTIAACGGGDESAEDGGGGAAEPLTMAQRVPTEAEAPGSEPDPVETPQTATGVEEFKKTLFKQLIEPTPDEERAFEKTGFVSAISTARFYPVEPGGIHTGDLPHVFALVSQFETEQGASDAAELLHDNGLKPCPEECAAQISEFEVDGIPNAAGVRRSVAAEDLEAAGLEGEPYNSFAIQFAEGVFAYDLELFGPPGEVSEEQAEELAGKLYDRVEGAPPKS
jgi:hypothetical protein